MDLDRVLSELAASVARQDEDGVLRQLLAVWDEARSPAIAAAVAWWSPRFVHRHPPLLAPARWHATAASGDPADVAALVAAPFSHEPIGTLRQRLPALMGFPPDPRLADYAVEIREHLARTQYLRAQEPEIEWLLAHHGPRGASPEGQRGDLWALARVVVASAPGKALEAQLLAAVYASPRDDGPRQVYADYLLSNHMPQAEIVAGSLRGESEPGASAPEQLQWWSRALLGLTGRNLVKYGRGFPYKLSTFSGVRPLPTPGWATLETFRLTVPRQEGARWMEEALPHVSLAGLRGLSLPASAWSTRLAQASRWPSLEMLWLDQIEPEIDLELALDESFLGELAQRPITIGLFFNEHPLWVDYLVSWVRRTGRGLRRVMGTQGRLTVAFARDEAGELRVLELYGLEHALPELRGLLRSVPAGMVDQIVVDQLHEERQTLRRSSYEARVRNAVEWIHCLEPRFERLPL